MTDLPILRELGVILLAATVLLLIARRLGAPSIAAYLVAGVLLGPATGLLASSESMELLAEVGIVLLLFLVGLELSLQTVRDVGRVVLVTALLQLVLTLAGGWGLGLLLGFTGMEAAVLAVALTFSSTVVVVKLLDQKGESGVRYGRIAIGVLLVQDIAVILALTLLGGLDSESAGGAGAMAGGIAVALASMAGLVLLAGLAARVLLPRVMGWAAGSLEVLFMWSLAWCFLFVVLAELLHLSVEVGGFLAGISLAQLPYSRELRRRVRPLMNFFIAVFFVSLGLHMQLEAAFERWGAVLALTAFVVVGKFLVVLFGATAAGEAGETSFRAGLALSQISEFSFILASLAIAKGYIGQEMLSVLGAVGLLTIGGSSALILGDRAVYRLAAGLGLGRLLREAPEADGEGAAEAGGHVIVVGMNALGRRIVLGLRGRGEEVVAVDTDPRKLVGLDCRGVLGSAEHRAVLQEAGLEGAKLVVSALQIEDVNNLIAFRARSAGIPCSIHAFDRSVVDDLQEIGADHLIDSKAAGLRMLARALRGLEAER